MQPGARINSDKRTYVLTKIIAPGSAYEALNEQNNKGYSLRI